MTTRIAIVGEAPGREEEKLKTPFVGASGQELRRMFSEAGLDFHSAYRTNVISTRPPGNNIKAFCASKKQVSEEYKTFERPAWFPPTYTFDKIAQGKYLRPQYLGNLIRLRQELEDFDPTLILAFGSVACWALLGQSGIQKVRGTCAYGTLVPFKVLPTYHPAAVLRQYELRPIVLADLMKAREESAFPEVRRPRRQVWINPTLDDLPTWETKFIRPDTVLGVDIETRPKERLVTMVGISAGHASAIVVPFYEPLRGSYWSSPREEVEAISWLRHIFSLPNPKVMANGLYDMAWLWTQFGLTIRNASDDVILLSHALQPEMKKSLGFQGSIWTNEPAWKLMRRSYKREDE